MSSDVVKVSTEAGRASDFATTGSSRARAANGLAISGKTDAVKAGLVSGIGEGALRGAEKGQPQAGGRASGKTKISLEQHVEGMAAGSMQDDTDAGGTASGATARAASAVARSRRSVVASNKQAAARAVQDVGGTGAQNASAKASRAAHGGIVATGVKDALVDELDNSDELSGVGTVNRSAKTTRSAFKRLQEKRGKATGVQAKKKAMQLKASQKKSHGIVQAANTRRAQITQATVRRRILAQGGKTAAGVLAPITAPLLGMILVVVMAFMFAQAFIAAISGDGEVRLDGLPEGITYEMVLAAVECQEKYGHPAGATLTQIVVESTGTHNGLSALAAPPHNNLFGIKYWSGYSDSSEYVTGYDLWDTQEASAAGDYYATKAAFCNFASARDCVYYRSAVFLQGSRYANNALIRQAIAEKSSDRMFEGLKDAGYATSPTYVEALKSICAQYDFYRFDGITVAQLERMAQNGGNGQEYNAADAEQKAIVDACRQTPFVGQGLCATWVSRVYSNAGWTYPWGNACDMYWNFCSSSARSDLEVGMMIAVPHSPYGADGWTYGHVGIYIGDNKVMHNASSLQITDLDAWISEYRCSSEPVKWGYPPR